MKILRGIDITSIPPRRNRADDPVTVALREGGPVQLTEAADLDAAQMRRLARRLADRARRRGLKQTRRTNGVAGERVMTVQWFRETPGDLTGPPVLRLVGQGMA